MKHEVIVAAPRERFARPLFLATIVTGSFLLFLTQPMIGRMALPRVGGAPAVWNSAMLVYQALLLGGYAYAHWIGRLRPRQQAGLHLALFALAALWLPIGLSGASPSSTVAPALWVPWFLVSSIGPLFFIVSAQAPLMQRWYALDARRGEPYALYAASNLGSFAGLICYPLLVEPTLTLAQQSQLWTAGYVLVALLVAGCALTVPKQVIGVVPSELSPAPSRRRILHWVALAAIPSGLMLSTTTHLTTDIVAMPLLWALPLGLYLLSFVIAFAARRSAADFITKAAPLIVLIAGGLTFARGSDTPLFLVTLGLGLLFAVAVALHGELFRLRPAPDRLTGFYLAMSVGGVIGGALCALVAPLVFDWTWEHPLLILAAALLIPQRPYLPVIARIWADPARAARLALWLPALAIALSVVADRQFTPDYPDWIGVAGPVAITLGAIVVIGRPLVFTLCLAALMMSNGGWYDLKLSAQDTRMRSYFGVWSVTIDRAAGLRTLTHGTTLHGVQRIERGREAERLVYYTPASGVGRALPAVQALYGDGADVGVIGLGAGTLACFAAPGQHWSFFEIDPAVVRIAATRFSFLARCAPDARIVIGDARLTLAREPARAFDVLVVDAFSSDSVPMHLLTTEAFAVYGRALRPDGLLLAHISNRYLDLAPVVAAGARATGWKAMVLRHSPSAAATREHAVESIWVAMSRDPRKLDAIIAAGDPTTGWRPLEPRRGFAGWTDDHASILPLLVGFSR